MDNFMACGICKKICVEPRLLNCLHSFCLPCLESRLLHEMNNERTLKCPICDSQVNIEGSCQSLPKNLVFLQLQRLSNCDSDDHGNEEFDIEEIDQLLNMTECQMANIKTKLSCIKEKYADVNVTLSGMDRKLGHAQVDMTIKISSFFSDLRNKLNNRLTQMEKNLQDEVKRRTENALDVNSHEKRWMESIRLLLADTEQYLDNVSIVTALHAYVAREAFDRLNSQLDIFDKKLTKINTELLDVKFLPADDEIQRMLTTDLYEVEFKNVPTYKVSDTNDVESNVISIDTPALEPSAPQLASLPPEQVPQPHYIYRAKFINTSRTHVIGERTDGYIEKICWLENDRLLLLDRSNQCLKLCNANTATIVAFQPFRGIATDLTRTKKSTMEHTFVMSLPELRQLWQIGVAGHNIYTKHVISTKIGYSCLAYDKDYSKLVCCVTMPLGYPRIDIVNGDGSVYKTYVWSQIMENPRRIEICDDGTMVVLDANRKLLLFISTYGQFLGVYKGEPGELLRDPAGLALDKNLNIYVTDSESHAIDVVKLDRSRICRIESNVDLGMVREIGLFNGWHPRMAVQNVSLGNGYISIYDITSSLPTHDGQPPSPGGVLYRQASYLDNPESSIPPTGGENESVSLPTAPPIDEEDPPTYESLFGTTL